MEAMAHVPCSSIVRSKLQPSTKTTKQYIHCEIDIYIYIVYQCYIFDIYIHIIQMHMYDISYIYMCEIVHGWI